MGQRVLGSILTFLQESPAPVFWIMTGNRVDGLPPELLRKGRLDEVFSVNVPTPEERMEIFRIHLRKRNQDPETVKHLAVAVVDSDGYVAAELEAAVKEAIVEAYTAGEAVTGELISQQLRHMKRLSEAFKKEFSAMENWAKQNARPASKDGTQGLQTFAKATEGNIIKRQARRQVENN